MCDFQFGVGAGGALFGLGGIVTRTLEPAVGCGFGGATLLKTGSNGRRVESTYSSSASDLSNKCEFRTLPVHNRMHVIVMHALTDRLAKHVLLVTVARTARSFALNNQRNQH